MNNQVTGTILAGGKARRMAGTDKGLIQINGIRMVEYVLTILAPQVHTVLINANRNIEEYQSLGYPVIPDDIPGYQGPLAGMASCMAHATTEFIITVPCDSPNIPTDYVSRTLHDLQVADADISIASDGERQQPVFALIRVALLASLLAFLQTGERKIDKWFGTQNMVSSDFSDKPGAFTNINTPDDIREFSQGINRVN